MDIVLPPFPNVILSSEQKTVLNLVDLQIKSEVDPTFVRDFFNTKENHSTRERW